MSVLSCHQNKTTLNTAALMEFMLHSKIYTHIVEPELCAKRAGWGTERGERFGTCVGRLSEQCAQRCLPPTDLSQTGFELPTLCTCWTL